ncbi:hypothetical protein [Martelella sp. FOR1707]
MLVFAAINLILGVIPKPWWWGAIVAFSAAAYSAYGASRVNAWRAEVGVGAFQANDIVLNMLVSAGIAMVAFFVGFGIRKIMDRKRR